MLLFQKRFHQGLIDGSVTLTFRAWSKPQVKPGGRYRCHPIGVIEVDAIERVMIASISEDDAQKCGFEARSALLDYMSKGSAAPPSNDEPVFRILLHYGGDGDRVTEALADNLTSEDVKTIRARLKKLDASSSSGPFTTKVLTLIEKHPRVAASQLAERLGREKLSFKADVIKLKKLGLTQSFEVGYELSPRGRAYREAIRRKPGRAE